MSGDPDFSRVDTLFAGEPPEPLLDAQATLRFLHRVLWIAIPLDVLAIPLWTGVPGALLTLWAWLRADAEVRQVEEGRYSDQDGRELLRLRRVSLIALIFVLVSFAIQIWLFTKPSYTDLYRGLLSG